MKSRIRVTFFILFTIYSLFFVIASALAPVMAHIGQYELSAKLTSLFIYSCHQQPDRTFWFLGYPMALCCRCYGVYIGTAISSIFAIYNKLKINKHLIILFILISCVDLYINYGMGIRVHNTGNVTRFIVGIIMGLLITIGINGLFNIKKGDGSYEN